MRILIIGGDGMLGHQLVRHFSAIFDVRSTCRDAQVTCCQGSQKKYIGVDARNIDQIKGILDEFYPAVVINAAGIVKQRAEASDVAASLEVNALLPNRLAEVLEAGSVRLIHFSTDCVFSGEKGMYKDDDRADADDLYGRTKYLGEVGEENCITLRTSIVGREVKRRASLVEWFLAQKGTVKGFRRALFSGFTTIEMARIVEKLIVDHPRMSGVWNVSADPISKYDLLHLIKKYYQHPVDIEPDEDFVIDRTLDSTRFRKETGYVPPSWDEMIKEMHALDMEKGR